MMRFLIMSTLAFLSVSFIYGQNDTVSPIADRYKTKKFDVAIFPASYLAFVSQPRFTPTRQEIDDAENALRINLKVLNKGRINQSSTPVIHRKLRKYKRQYFGYVTQNGQRILLINFFWSKNIDFKDRWLKEAINFHDGGSYYWQVQFNLDEAALFDLNINGYA